MKSPKVVIIGLDAAVMSLLQPWVDQGKLPNLADLMSKGVSGQLESAMPPLTPAAWTSFMTGMNQGKHGIYNFMEHEPEGYGMVYTNGGDRKAESLWKIANRSGYTVGVMNTPYTYPPEKLDGFQISGLDTPSSASAFVHPPELKKEIEDKFGPLNLDARYLGGMTNLEKRVEAVKEFEAGDKQWSQLALYLLEEHPQDIMMFTFMSIDTVEHHFWHYMDKNHFYHDAEGAKLLGDVILNTYQRLDKTIGEIVRKLPPSCHVFVVSDHGQEAISDRTLFINRILAQAGLLAYKPVNPITTAIRALIQPVYGFLKQSLTHSQKVKLAYMFPKLRDNADGIVTSYNEIDWSRTKVFSHEAWATPPSVIVNLKGCKPEGIVDMEDYESVLQEAMKALYAVTDPRTGKQVIAKAYRREELYKGPYADRAADLTLKWWGDSPFNTKASLRKDRDLSPILIEEPKPMRMPEWSGHHTLDGIVVASGPSIKEGQSITGARLIDLAPTILYLLKVPIPDNMDGTVLQDMLEQPVLAGKSSHAVSCAPEPVDVASGHGYSSEEASLVEERLKNLGYLE